MPTYEYKCRDCGHAFERFQGINEPALEVCPECEGRVQRLISTGGGLVFKGPGFYATDYRSGGSRSSGSTETADSGAKTDSGGTSDSAKGGGDASD